MILNRNIILPAFFLAVIGLFNQSILVFAEDKVEPSSESMSQGSNLSDDDKEKLRLEKWRSADPAHKEALRQRYEQFKNLPSEEQQRLKKNWEKLKSLSPEERNVLKVRWERWKRLSAGERKAFRERKHRFNAMTPQQQERLQNMRKNWRTLPPEERRRLRENFRRRTQARWWRMNSDFSRKKELFLLR